MKTPILSVITFLLLASAFSATAEMYKWVDQEGNISYSDQPPFEDATPLEPPQLNTTPAFDVSKKTTTPAAKADPADDATQETKYDSFKISSPQNDATIRDNNGNFSISLSVSPALNLSQGHYFVILLDGITVRDKLTTASLSLTNIDRGTHQITAVIKNAQGKTLQLANHTVHLFRQSSISKPPAGN